MKADALKSHPISNLSRNEVRTYTIALISVALTPAILFIAGTIWISFNQVWDFLFFFAGVYLLIAWNFLFIILLPLALWKKKGKLIWVWPISMLLLWISIQLFQASPSPNNTTLSDDSHFKAEYPKYEAIVKKAPLRKHIFQWSADGFVTTASTERSIIYDPGDTLPAINAAKNRLWKLEALKRNKSHPGRIVETRAMGRHYYLVKETIIPW